ncbi:MAG: hypothetical protein MUF15_18550 [Acidobacteria bacterium]|jgi:hypothetical protein|nr:hypothetical protein [Acidobacteriota bacterium]
MMNDDESWKRKDRRKKQSVKNPCHTLSFRVFRVFRVFRGQLLFRISCFEFIFVCASFFFLVHLPGLRVKMVHAPRVDARH